MAKKVLKVFLKKNQLTDDPNDYSAVLSSMGSLTKDDLIDEIMAEGIEIKRDTIVSIVTRYNRKAADKALTGYNVNTGLVYMRPVVKGVFYDKTWSNDRNSVYVSITQGSDLRAAVSETEVQILGMQSDPIELYGITDQVTGATDGTLTRGRNAELKGSYIKVAGNDPAVGITLRNSTTQTEVKLAASDIVLNEPSRLLIYVPSTFEITCVRKIF